MEATALVSWCSVPLSDSFKVTNGSLLLRYWPLPLQRVKLKEKNGVQLFNPFASFLWKKKCLSMFPSFEHRQVKGPSPPQLTPRWQSYPLLIQENHLERGAWSPHSNFQLLMPLSRNDFSLPSLKFVTPKLWLLVTMFRGWAVISQKICLFTWVAVTREVRCWRNWWAYLLVSLSLLSIPN